MAKYRIRRQGVTPKGVLRRLGDIPFNRVVDPRRGPHFRLPRILRLTVLSLMAAGNSQRAIESRSEQLRAGAPMASAGFGERIADNTVGTLIRRLEPRDLRGALHVAVKAESRRRSLDGRVGGRRPVALDGKVLSKVSWPFLVSAAKAGLSDGDARASDPNWKPDVEELRRLLRLAGLAFVQVVRPKSGAPYGLVRLHRWTLTCAKSAVCVDEQPIQGDSSESATACASLDALVSAYARTTLFDTITADAGNTSQAFAARIVEHGLDYVLAIKNPQGGVYTEAVSRLEKAEPNYQVDERRSGTTVRYRVFVSALPEGWPQWDHARQLVRIERTVGKSTGNRYYVTSLGTAELSAEQALAVCRAHWRCENENHWTADTMFNEDTARAPLSRHPTGMLVASLLRMLAMNILAVLRSMSRVGEALEKPSWLEARLHVLAVAFRPVLDAEEFDAVA